MCIHSGGCVQELPVVFDVRRRDWVRPYAATAEEVAAQIERYPSGALQYICFSNRNSRRPLSPRIAVLCARLMNEIQHIPHHRRDAQLRYRERNDDLDMAHAAIQDR